MVTKRNSQSGTMRLFAVLAGACASLLATALPAAANPQLVVDVSSRKVYEQQEIYPEVVSGVADQADDGLYDLPCHASPAS